MEVWKQHPVFLAYEISTEGRVRRLDTRKILAGSLRPDKYRQHSIGGTCKLAGVLVLETFVGPRPQGNVARHIDDDRSNNRLVNLKWGTHAENSADMVRNAREAGRGLSAEVLSKEQVLEICQRLDADGKTKDIAADFGVKHGTITAINTGRSWAWLTGRDASFARIGVHPNSKRKLTEVKVEQIRQMINDGVPMTQVAKRFCVAAQTIQQIKSGRIWPVIAKEK